MNILRSNYQLPLLSTISDKFYKFQQVSEKHENQLKIYAQIISMHEQLFGCKCCNNLDKG